MKFAIYTFFALIAFVYSDESANQFVDDVIDALSQQKNFDPLHVHDHKSQFDKKIGLIEVKGELDFRQTVITGLSHIKRNGNSKLDTKDNGFVAKMRLGDNKIKVDSEMTVKLGELIHPNLHLVADVGNIDIQFSAIIGDDGNFKLKEFVIDELKHVKVQVHGLSILDPFIDITSDLFIVFFNKDARETITETIRPMVAAELSKLKPNN